MREIIYILLNVIVVTLWVQGVTLMLGKGMILSFVTDWSDKYFDRENPTWIKYYLHWICKPLFLCSMCMSSVHGLLVYSLITFLNYNRFNFIEYVLIAVCSVSIISFTSKFIN